MILNNSYLEKILPVHYLSNDQKISSFESGKGHCINSKNFKITLSSGRKFYLKMLSQYNKNIIGKIELMDECYRAGIKAPEIVRNKEGQLFTIAENILFLLLNYYAGEKCHFTVEEIFSAGENLACLNRKLSRIDDFFERDQLYNDLNEMEIEQIKQKITVKNWFIEKVSNLCEELPQLYFEINKIVNSKEKKLQIVHIDYNLQNVLFNNNEVQVILDFDSLVTAPELQSVAFASDRFSKDEQGMMTFLEGYQKEKGSFSSEQMKLIPSYIKREALCRINYILRTYFFHNDKTWSFELDKHLEILQRIESINTEFFEV